MVDKVDRILELKSPSTKTYMVEMADADGDSQFILDQYIPAFAQRAIT